MIVVSPRAAALRILAVRGAAPPNIASSFSLAEYQIEAVAKAAEIMRRRGGVIVADGVGLGKTYIAAALIEQALACDRQVVVAIPAALGKTWRRALAPLLEQHLRRVVLITHGQLSRGITVESPALVVVDEAHAFRNPRTRRYRALRLVCRAANVVLLTATPVNNSLADLYFQLRIFARDDAFRDVGVGSIRLLLRPDEIDSDSLQRLRNAVMIRRSREQLRARYRELKLPDAQILRFPHRVELRTVGYLSTIQTAELRKLLDDVMFAVYPEQAPRLLLGLSLLKRIQSSRAAALASLRRLIQLHVEFLTALQTGHLLRPRDRIARETDQLCFTELISEPAPRSINVALIRDVVSADLSALTAFKVRLEAAADRKLPRLVELLSARAPPTKTLVFTEFADTAFDLWRAIAPRYPSALITGGAAFLGLAPASRWDVIKRFAPVANGVRVPAPTEAVSVLIATDVLAEGLNLQDADAVVSYDLPWNPVRLIQRAGRIDRIGSPHDMVTIHNFIPDNEFDEFIGLVSRLRHKLASIRCAVGHDAAVLEPDEVDERFYRDLAAGRNSVLHDPVEAKPVRIPVVDVAAAGPVGSVAAVAATASRVLIVFENGSALRELLVVGSAVTEANSEADEIVERALGAEVCVELPEMMNEAIATAVSYLEAEGVVAIGSRETSLLARAVQQAVTRIGLGATTEVIATADRLLAGLPGFVGDPARLIADLRNAGSANALLETMITALAACRETPKLPAKWSLVAAIACD
jgi:hypothetical protein